MPKDNNDSVYPPGIPAESVELVERRRKLDQTVIEMLLFAEAVDAKVGE